MSRKIDKNIFSFLKTLEKNNNREWFNENKPTFRTAEQDVKLFYNVVLEKLKDHDSIEKLKQFRIYRDVRFSKNKVPYKTHFGGSFHRTKPEYRGGYYVHIQPNNESFLGTGFWAPEKEDLFRIRKEIEMDDTEIRKIINEKAFKNMWGDLVGDSLKTAPKGFSKAHHAIDLIRKKQYLFIKKITDKEVLSPQFIDTIDEAFKLIRPYFNYMSNVLTTDLNGESTL